MKDGDNSWIEHYRDENGVPLRVQAEQGPDGWAARVFRGRERGAVWSKVYKNKDLSDPVDGDAVTAHAWDEFCRKFGLES